MSAGRFQRRIGDYLMPDQLASLEDLDRWLHRDLAGMPNDRLFAENQQVPRAFALALGRRWFVPAPGGTHSVRADTWLRERLQEVRAEIQRRNGRPR